MVIHRPMVTEFSRSMVVKGVNLLAPFFINKYATNETDKRQQKGKNKKE